MDTKMTPPSLKGAVAQYQCPGCVSGTDPESCWEYCLSDTGCTSHCPGTLDGGARLLFLGLPKGFTLVGPAGAGSFQAKLKIFESTDHLYRNYPELRTLFSLPIWKHLDDQGNTIMRWYSPRTNVGWSLVILGDAREDFPYAREITAEELKDMD